MNVPAMVGLPYEKLTPLSPPRAENQVLPESLPLFEERGYLAQFKKNGTYSVVYVSPAGEVSFLDRNKKPHASSFWAPGPAKVDQFRRRAGKGWRVFCAELLHKKGDGGHRDTFYLHDVLVMDGEHLVGSTYAQRYSILQDVFLRDGSAFTSSHWVLDEGLWLARNIRKGFRTAFDSIADPRQDEGLVLKDPRGALSIRPSPGWSVKCRRPAANYGF